MPNYDFTHVMINVHTSGYMIPFEYGPLFGFIIGFCITLAKSPPFILMDCFYGAMLGFFVAVSYNLFAWSFEEPARIIVQETPPFHSNRANALYEEMQRDREHYANAKREKQKQEAGPIYLRTRSRMRSYSH